jgi:HD domain
VATVPNHLQTVKRSQRTKPRETPQIVAAAADQTRSILGSVPDRLAHSEGVARRAQFLTQTVAPKDAPLLVAAAWLHDVGYAPELRDTGFHPLDGARYLRSIGWSQAICDLVAHHSGARFVARFHDLDKQLARYRFSLDAVSDALTVADQTTGLFGERVTVEQRMSDMLRRHGRDSANALAHPDREPYLREATVRVTARLESFGVHTELTELAAAAH